MSMTEKFLQMMRSTLQSYTGEETLTHDDDSKKNKLLMKKHLHVQSLTVNMKMQKSVSEWSENEEENDESQDKDEATTLRCDETNLQLYQRNRTNNQNCTFCMLTKDEAYEANQLKDSNFWTKFKKSR